MSGLEGGRLRIEQAASGKWQVLLGDDVLTEVDSNAAAWHWLDRNEIHPNWMTNRAADRLEGWTAPDTTPAARIQDRNRTEAPQAEAQAGRAPEAGSTRGEDRSRTEDGTECGTAAGQAPGQTPHDELPA